MTETGWRSCIRGSAQYEFAAAKTERSAMMLSIRSMGA